MRSRPYAPTVRHYFDQLAATVEERGQLRWARGQVVTLADEAPGMSDEQLRTKLLALAESCAR